MPFSSIFRKIKYRRILHTIGELYHRDNPFMIAKAARPDTLSDFYYGEIDLCAFLDLLAMTHPQPNAIFYDLGSGCGKTLFAAKLAYPRLEVRGIELVADLHALGSQKLVEYLSLNKKFHLQFICDDLLQQDFTDANILFINATAYSVPTWEQINSKLLNLKTGTKIIITSKTLPQTHFIPYYSGMEQMSWGLTSTYIYVKR